MNTRIVLCCGTGGVGKTTTAAALGVAHALAGSRVCVLTIDPARRLADALGLRVLGNDPQEVDLSGLTVPKSAGLWALMLDKKATFDEAVRQLSPDAESAERLLNNRYYRAVSTRLTGAHEYMAAEKLHQLASSGRFDVLVVDTPPSQHAIEFFHAPDRLQKLFAGPVLGSLVNPGRGLTGGGTRRLLTWVLSLVGRDVVEDISEFFRLVGHVSRGFSAHSADVGRWLRSDRTHLLLITSPASAAREGALQFLAQVRQDGLRVDGFVINRFVEATPVPEVSWSAPAPPGTDAADWGRWLRALRDEADRLEAVSERHRTAALDLSKAAAGAPVWALPYLPEGLRSTQGLAALAERLPPHAAPTLGAWST
jgi:anion-transporting  ArsA/GET3 family ATPase